jgi:hypothetical protein
LTRINGPDPAFSIADCSPAPPWLRSLAWLPNASLLVSSKRADES